MNYARLTQIAIGLWALHGLTLLAATTEVITGVSQTADLLSRKDVVFLALATAIVSILFSGWVVNKMIVQQAAHTRAINALVDELRTRPCYYNLELGRKLKARPNPKPKPE